MCLECSFFDDDLDKKQFHCSACGICRVGGRNKFFHCDTCGCCYAKSLQVLQQERPHLLAALRRMADEGENKCVLGDSLPDWLQDPVADDFSAVC